MIIEPASMRTTETIHSQPESSRGSSEDLRWRAVETRDASFDGAFVYAVRSTGIYCRPWCPSRHPRRGQVVFSPPRATLSALVTVLAGGASRVPQVRGISRTA